MTSLLLVVTFHMKIQFVLWNDIKFTIYWTPPPKRALVLLVYYDLSSIHGEEQTARQHLKWGVCLMKWIWITFMSWLWFPSVSLRLFPNLCYQNPTQDKPACLITYTAREDSSSLCRRSYRQKLSKNYPLAMSISSTKSWTHLLQGNLISTLKTCRCFNLIWT